MVNLFILAMLIIFMVSLIIGGPMLAIAGGAAIIALIVSQVVTSETDIED